MVAKFLATEGPDEGLELTLDKGDEWVIGRDADKCNLVIKDPSASKRHTRCRKTPQGYTLENLTLTNPILVNDEVVEELQMLSEGDTVKIGDTVFLFSQNGKKPEVEKNDENEVEEEKDFDSKLVEKEQAGISKINFDMADGNRWVLKVISGPNTGAELSLEANKSYIIGTDTASCDIVLQDISISRKHARINVSRDEQVIIEDLQSRNGIFVDGEQVKEKQVLSSNKVITLGTTSFLVYDQDDEAATVIPPIVPSFMRGTAMRMEKESAETGKALAESTKTEDGEVPEPVKGSRSGAFFILLLVGVLVAVGFGLTTLFNDKEVVQEKVDVTNDLSSVMVQYPSIKYSFNPTTGKLLLIGHTLTSNDRSQLLYKLQNLNFIKSIDDNIVIDEYIWQESNQILGKNPEWAGVTIHSPAPGQFVVSGFLKTRKQLDTLLNHLSLNFPYMNLLEKKLIVEEEIKREVDARLKDQGVTEVTVDLTNGELILSGTVAHDQFPALEKLLKEFKGYEGIKALKNFVVEVAPEESMVDISAQYQVTGWSLQGDTSLNIVINGRILSRGDVLDGMTITSIKPNAIFLEKDGFKYRINYRD